MLLLTCNLLYIANQSSADTREEFCTAHAFGTLYGMRERKRVLGGDFLGTADSNGDNAIFLATSSSVIARYFCSRVLEL